MVNRIKKMAVKMMFNSTFRTNVVSMIKLRKYKKLIKALAKDILPEIFLAFDHVREKNYQRELQDVIKEAIKNYSIEEINAIVTKINNHDKGELKNLKLAINKGKIKIEKL